MIQLNNRQKIYTQKLLECVAKGISTIYYSELSNMVGASAQSVGKDIGQISILCHELGLPLISGMVVNIQTQYPDIDGFGVLCKEVGEYQEFGRNFTGLFKQCLKDIQECKKWYILTEYLGIKIDGISNGSNPLPMQEKEENIEGARIQITATAYERNPVNRVKCLNKFGTSCQICGFNAGKIYGKEFEGCIHVHHITPLSETGQDHSINPETDLIPVCPNCHMILHSKKNGTYTLEEVRKMIAK